MTDRTVKESERKIVQCNTHMKFLEKILYFQVIETLLYKLRNVMKYTEKYHAAYFSFLFLNFNFRSHLLLPLHLLEYLPQFHSFWVCNLIHILQNRFNQREGTNRLLKQQREYKECTKVY